MAIATKTTRRFDDAWGGTVLQGLTGSVLMLLLMFSAMADDVHDAYVAEEVAKLPKAGVPLFGALPVEHLKVFGPPEIVDSSIVTADGVPFGRARRVVVKKRGQFEYQAQLQVQNNITPINKGDTVFVQLWVRTTQSNDESGEGRYASYLQRKSAPWTNFHVCPHPAPTVWTRVCSNFVSKHDVQPGTVHLSFHLAGTEQSLEFGGFIIRNLGPGVKRHELPHTEFTYEGRESNAPWRAAAAKRIEQHRKGDLTLRVVDAKGQPVEGARVKVEMKRHAYAFGTYIQHDIMENKPGYDQFRNWVPKLFNKVTVNLYTGDGRWGWCSPWGPRQFKASTKWAHELGLELRGHVLVYPWHKFCPPELVALKGDKEATQNWIRNYMKDIMGELRQYDIVDLDVTNELRQWKDDMVKTVGREGVAEWYRMAREVAPDAILYLNDNTILTNGGRTKNEQDIYIDWLKYLIDQDVGLGGIGMQSHFGETLTPPDKVLEILDRFAKLGLDIQITEFDINTANEKVQADYTRDFLTTVFSHPATKGFIMWGFWEGRHWRPLGAMLRKDFSPKPNLKVWQDLVYKQWWTNVTGATDKDGVFRARGFLGDYTVTAEAGTRVTVDTKLTMPGTKVTLKLSTE